MIDIRILHLSDFHFSEQTAWDSSPVLRGMTDAIKELVDNGLAPDVVALTGDIAHEGKHGDYVVADRWLQTQLLPALGDFDPRNLLIVPGNHDVDRTKVTSASQAIQRNLLESRSQKEIAQLLGGIDSGVLLRRHDAFLQFMNDYKEEDEQSETPWWVNKRNIAGTEVGFMGLCSSWMSGERQEQGDLLVGAYQVNTLIETLGKTHFRIALMHHPFQWLREFDEQEVEQRIHQSCVIVLRGHLHRADARGYFSDMYGCLELASGSAYDNSAYPNAFQLVEFNPESLVATVHYRLWRDNRWVADRNAYSADENGVARFHLQQQLSRGVRIPGQISTESTMGVPSGSEYPSDYVFLNHIAFYRESDQQEFQQRTGINLPHYQIRVIVDSFYEGALEKIDRVVYHLHEAYDQYGSSASIQVRKNYRDKFLLKEIANGEYLLRAEVFLKGETYPIFLQRYINLWEHGPRIENYL